MHTSTTDPAYIDAMRGLKMPNTLKEILSNNQYGNSIGVNPSSYLQMDMRPYIDGGYDGNGDGATGLHQNNYGYGETFYNNIPYIQECTQGSSAAWYVKCDNDPAYDPLAAAAAAHRSRSRCPSRR